MINVPQKRGVLDLPLSIFFALLALYAIPGVGQRIEALKADFLAAVVAFPELLGVAIQSTQCFVDVPQESAFLAGEEERFLALHRVGPLVGHVE